MSIKLRWAMSIIVGFMLLIGACNMPSERTPEESDVNIIYTAAAQTVEAQITQMGGTVESPLASPETTQGTPQATAIESTDTASPPTITPTPTNTPVPPTPTPKPCDQIEFVDDVNYPDDTGVDPGETFVKTWRLKNDGSCTWTSGYDLVFFSGDAMNAPAAVQLTTGSVSPGETVDISVTLTAPDTGGSYRGEFKLRSASNVIFGLGDSQKPFWVQIEVIVAKGLVYDFNIKASSADWVSGIGNDAGDPLAFDGDDNALAGAAKIKDGVKLETGSTSGKILLTHPYHDGNGFIKGVFPEYTVQNGDRLKVRLGFMILGGSCGAGKVKFKIGYQENGTSDTLGEWTKSCNGNLQVVNIDLSSLKGKTVNFVFTVLAEGSFTDDWAVWNSPLIEN